MIRDIEQKTHIFNLPRRRIRYWCFRFRTEELYGTSSNGAPAGLREYFEKIPGFTKWEEFAVSWDLPHLDNCNYMGHPPIGLSCSCSRQIVPLVIMGRLFSIWDEWKMTIRQEAPVLKIKGSRKANQAKSISEGS
jgi:hypothetical protein